MKKTALILALTFIFAAQTAPGWGAKKDQFHGTGEVVTVDPLYDRITIRHEAIDGLAGDGENEYFVSSSELLKNIHTRDLVTFRVKESRGETLIDQIEKTGVAEPEKDSTKIGETFQQMLEVTGEAAKAVTAPLPPAREVVGGAADATTRATGSVIEEVSPDVQNKF